MKKSLLSLAVTISLSSLVFADQPAVTGPFKFVPKVQSTATGSLPACEPFSLPAGFTQTVIVEEKAVCGGIVVDAVPGQSDLTDMNTVNETGVQAGRFLYRTHETGGGTAALSVIDLKTGETAVYTAADFGISPGWSRFDGILWTKWGTLLAAEETTKGRLFECAAEGLVLECVDRPALGRMAHEGIAGDPQGAIYVGDELNGGSIYKFVPNSYGDLSTGTLYGLDILDEGTDGINGTGLGEWVALVPGQNGVVTDPTVDARAAANEAGLTDYLRPEDAEMIGQNLYFATTTDNRVLQIPTNTANPVVTEYVGVNIGNISSETASPLYGLRSPDNLASDHAGNLVIVEDNVPSDIWVAGKDLNHDGAADNVELFATLTTLGAEGTGIYFAPSMPKAMFVNVQHAADGNDMTVLITAPSNAKK